jgi:hypothetical protein
MITRLQIVKLLDGLNIRSKSDPLGLTIMRAGTVHEMPFATERTPLRRTSYPGGQYRQEHWRLCCGSGIASNSGVWHLAPISNLTWHEALGPYLTQRDLSKALRAWRRWELP